MADSSSSAAGEGKRPRKRWRVRESLAFVQSMRPALYALLVGSALLTFWAGGEIGGHRLPSWAELIAPVLFGLFLLVFAVYRLALIRAQRYPSSKGLFQIGLGALVFVLLLPATRRATSLHPPYAEPAHDEELVELLGSGDARVRALAAEVAGMRGAPARLAPELAQRLSDPDERVQRACRAALTRLLGSDLTAGLSADAARERVDAELRLRHWLPPR